MPTISIRPRPRVLAATFACLAVAVSNAPAQDPGARSLLEQPLSTYKARRDALMARVKELEKTSAPLGLKAAGSDGAQAAAGAEVIVVMVGETEEHDDGRYRQNNNFAYLTGVETPGASLILWPNRGKEVLYLPARDPMMERWTGPKIGPGAEGIAATGAVSVEPAGSFRRDLLAAVGEGIKPGQAPPVVYLMSPEPYAGVGGNEAAVGRMLKEKAPHAKFKRVAPLIGELRKIKSPSEIALLRKAIAITGDAQASAIRELRPGVPEYKLEGAILGAFIGGGGSRAGFPSIVGSGINSTVLHYNANRRTMQDGDLVVVDIGADYAFYTADITRTYPVNGKFTPRQREVYQLVLDCQSACAANFKTGVSTLGSQNAFASQFLRNSPLRAKDESGNERTMDTFFVHGLGHYLGMDVHDVGNGRLPLTPGAVITIEPGIYLPAEGFGVRIEDDYLVTSSGLEKISKDIPVEVADLERLIAESQASKAKVTAAARPNRRVGSR